MPISKQFAEPYWIAPGNVPAKLYLGDVRECLRGLPTRSVHCVVTSPPYWGLRDYGTGDKQIGLENTPAEYILHLVEVFSEVKRVLRDDGTLWLNLGDTFDNGQQLIPAQVALALIADGWKLIQDIIWYAPNKMPESVTNRCTKSHEHIFLLTKGNDYYFDSMAIAEEGKSEYKSSDFIPKSDKNREEIKMGGRSSAMSSANGRDDIVRKGMVNKRDVWIVSIKGYTGKHFAVFSSDLITPCILAGTSEYGCCAKCGKPYERVTTKNIASNEVGSKKGSDGNRNDDGRGSCNRDRSFEWSRNGKLGTNSTLDGVIATKETVGWRKICGCHTTDIIPCTVLDPFVGSGTTVATSLQLDRGGIGIDLSEVYLREHAIPRIEAAMRGEKLSRRPALTMIPVNRPCPIRFD